MKKLNTKSSLILIALFFLMIALMGTDVGATNGYFSHGFGAQNKAMAGAGVAFPIDALSAATNPAGMVMVGSRYDFNLSLFVPNRKYTVTGNPSMQPNTFPLTPGTVESDSKVFIIPAFAVNWMINEKSSIGISMFGNGGMNTNYPVKTFDSPLTTVTSPTGVNLSQLFIATTYARKLNDKFSVGVSGIVSYQMFDAKGLQAFGGFSSDPTKLTDNDNSNSTGVGGRIGILGELTDGLFIGASYQTKMYMKEFEEYAGLFAEQGDFDIPSNWTIGVGLEASRVLTIAFDVQQIKYSEVNAIANPMNPQNFGLGILLGSDNGAGFGWEDMTIFKFGLEWEGIVDLPLRFGYSFGEQPIPDTEHMFNILAPGVMEQHVSFGFSRKLCDTKELTLTVMHALNNSIVGDNPMEVPGQQTIELEMNQWEFTVGFTF